MVLLLEQRNGTQRCGNAVLTGLRKVAEVAGMQTDEVEPRLSDAGRRMSTAEVLAEPEVADMETEEVEPRVCGLSDDERRMPYIQRAADCCICTALAAEHREIPFEQIITTVSELLDGDGCGK